LKDTYASKRRLAGRAFVEGCKKDKPCLDCGKVYPSYVMDFDHVRGAAKKGDLSSLISWGRSIRFLANEIAKCDLVCANCHRERTHNASDKKF